MALQSRVMRIIAGIFGFLFFGTNCLFAYSTESNLWAERRRAREQRSSPTLLASLPVGAPTSPFFSQFPPPQKIESSLSQTIARSVPKSFLKDHAALLAALSPAYGTIRKVSLSPKPSTLSPIVIHIQDVHQNLDAQKNIGQLVGSLLQGHHANMIALEGTWGNIDLKPFQEFPNRKAVELSADYLLEKNQISGPIRAALLGTGPLPPVIGVDDPVHYKANVEAYRQSVPLLKELKKDLAARKAILDQEKNRFFSPELKIFDDAVESYRSGRSNLVDYVHSLTNLKLNLGVPLSIQRFQETVSLEKSIDFKQVEIERSRLIEGLVEKLSRREIEELAVQSVAYRSGEVSYAHFYRNLQTVCSKSGVSLNRFPAMKNYIHYILSADGINAELLFGDLMRFENTVYAKLATTPEAKSVVKKVRSFYLAMKLVDFALTPEEWKEYQSTAIANTKLSTFENFYREADARDIAMASHLLKAISGQKTPGTSILVTGGYHSPGLTSQLVQSGATVISVVPKIEKVETTQGATYLSVFTQEKTPLDQIFSGDRLFLSQDPMSEKSRTVCLPSLVAVSDGGESFGSIKKAFVQMVPEHIMSRILRVVETVREGFNQITVHFSQGTEYVASASSRSGPRSAGMILSEKEILKRSLNPLKLLGEQVYVVPAVLVVMIIALIGLATQTHFLFVIAALAGIGTLKLFEKYFLSIHPSENAQIFGLDEATYYQHVRRGYWFFGGFTLISLLLQIMGLPAIDFHSVALMFLKNVFVDGVVSHGFYNFLNRVPAMASLLPRRTDQLATAEREKMALHWMSGKLPNLPTSLPEDSLTEDFLSGLRSLESLRDSNGAVNLLSPEQAGVVAFSWVHDGHCSIAVYRPDSKDPRFSPGVRVHFSRGIGARTLGLKPDRRYDVENALTGARLTGDYLAYGTSSVAMSESNGFYIHFSPGSHWVFLTYSERPVLSQPVDQFNVRSDLAKLERRDGVPHVELGTLSKLRERFMRDLKRMASSPWIMAILRYSRIRQDRSNGPHPSHFDVDGKKFLSVRGGLGTTGEDTIEQGSPFATLGPLDLDPRLIATGDEWKRLRSSAEVAWNKAEKDLKKFLSEYLGISPGLAETFTAGLDGDDSLLDRAAAAKAIKEFASEIHEGGGRPVVDFVTNHLGLESPLVRQWANNIGPVGWEQWEDAEKIREFLDKGDEGGLGDYLSQTHPDCFVFRASSTRLVLLPYSEVIYKPIKDDDLNDDDEEEANRRLLEQNPGFHVYYRNPGDPRSRILIAYADDGNYSYPDVLQLNYMHPHLRKCMAESLQVWASLGVNVRADLAFLALRDHVKGKWFPGMPQRQFDNLYPDEFWVEVFRGTYSVRKDFQVMGEIYDSGHKHALTEIGLLTYDMEHTLKLLVDLKFKDFRRWLKDTPPWILRGLVGSLRNHDDPIDIQNTELFRQRDKDEIVRAILTVQSAMPNAPITLARLLSGQYHKVMMEEALRVDDEPVRPEEWESHVTWREGWRKRLTPFVDKGEYKFLSQRYIENENIVAQSWEFDGETMVVITNLSENSQEAALDLPPGLSGRLEDNRCYRALDLYDGDVPTSYVYTGGQLKRDGLFVKLPPWKSHVLYFSKESNRGLETDFPRMTWHFAPPESRGPPEGPKELWPKKEDGSQVVGIEAIYRLSPPNGKRHQGIGKLTYLKSLITRTLVPMGATGLLLLPFGPLCRGGLSPYAYTNGVDPLLIDWTEVPDVDDTMRRIHQERLEAIPELERNLLFRERVRARELPVGPHWTDAIGWKAYRAFLDSAHPSRKNDFGDFNERNGPWLDRYAKFEALMEIMGKPPTQASDLELAVAAKDPRYNDLIGFYKYAQWVALDQLKSATALGLQQGIRFFFDRPFYYGKDSPEVWAHRNLFEKHSPGVFDMTKGWVEWGDLIQPDFFAMGKEGYSLLLEPFEYLLAEAGFSGVRLDAGDRYATAGINTENPLLRRMITLLNQYGAVAVAEAFGRQEDKKTLTDNGVMVMEDGFWEWGKNAAGALTGNVAVQLDSHDLPGITIRAGLPSNASSEDRKRAVLSAIERALRRGPAFLLFTLGNVDGDPTRINVGNTVNRTNWRDMGRRPTYDLANDIQQLISNVRGRLRNENNLRDANRRKTIASAKQLVDLLGSVQGKCEKALSLAGTEFTWRRHPESGDPHQITGFAGLNGLLASYKQLSSERGWVSSITHHATQGDLFKHTIGILVRAELDLAHWPEGKPFWNAIAQIIGLQEWPREINSTESAAQLIDNKIAEGFRDGNDSSFFEFRDERLMLFLENSLALTERGKTAGQERDPGVRFVEALVGQKGFQEWFSAQRYYLNKGQKISEMSLEDLLFLVPETDDKPAIYGCVFRVGIEGGEDSLYYVPLILSRQRPTDFAKFGSSHFYPATQEQGGPVIVAGAEHTLVYQEHVRKMMVSGEKIETEMGGHLIFENPLSATGGLANELIAANPLAQDETSNSLTVVTGKGGPERIVKTFRRIAVGDPEAELVAALRDEKFPYAPEIFGIAYFETRDGNKYPLWFAMEKINGPPNSPGQSQVAKTVAQILRLKVSELLQDYREGIQKQDFLKDRFTPSDEESMTGLDLFGKLGKSLVGFFVALGRSSARGFGIKEPDQNDARLLAEGPKSNIDKALGLLAHGNMEHGFDVVLTQLGQLSNEINQFVGHLTSTLDDIPMHGRISGDNHLEQMVLNGEEIFLLDFGGAPAASIEERRRKAPGVMDLGGLLGSLSYIQFFTLLEQLNSRNSGAYSMTDVYNLLTGTNLETYSRQDRNLALYSDRIIALMTDTLIESYIREIVSVNATSFYMKKWDPEKMKGWILYSLLSRAAYEINYEISSRPKTGNVLIPMYSLIKWSKLSKFTVPSTPAGRMSLFVGSERYEQNGAALWERPIFSLLTLGTALWIVTVLLGHDVGLVNRLNEFIISTGLVGSVFSLIFSLHPKGPNGEERALGLNPLLLHGKAFSIALALALGVYYLGIPVMGVVWIFSLAYTITGTYLHLVYDRIHPKWGRIPPGRSSQSFSSSEAYGREMRRLLTENPLAPSTAESFPHPMDLGVRGLGSKEYSFRLRMSEELPGILNDPIDRKKFHLGLGDISPTVSHVFAALAGGVPGETKTLVQLVENDWASIQRAGELARLVETANDPLMQLILIAESPQVGNRMSSFSGDHVSIGAPGMNPVSIRLGSRVYLRSGKIPKTKASAMIRGAGLPDSMVSLLLDLLADPQKNIPFHILLNAAIAVAVSA